VNASHFAISQRAGRPILAGTILSLLASVNGRGIKAGVHGVKQLPLVMVVEDDQEVQSIVDDALIDGGFEPAIMASGEEALGLLHANADKYRALLVDIHLRGKMDGWEIAKRARIIKPDFPVVYMTAANGHEWSSQGVPNSLLLPKPFAPAQLANAVSSLLDDWRADNLKRDLRRSGACQNSSAKKHF
jgi:CheY-like chemotaxis protein